MSDHFTAEFFRGNRERLRQLFTGTAPIVITAQGRLQRNADSAYPFRQDANFWYLTGLDEPDAVLVMDKTKEYLIMPTRSAYQETFDDHTTLDEISRQSGISSVLVAKDGWKQLSTRLKNVKHVATLAANPEFIKVYGMYSNPARANLARRLKEVNPNLELLDLRQHLARLRMVKQPIELDALQAAIDLTVAALKKVKTSLTKYRFEYEIEAEITAYFLKHGADNAWKPIVASGANAVVLHTQQSSSRLKTKDLVLLDIGADAAHYAADLTRTWSIGGKSSKRQQAVHEAVLEVQNYAYGLLKPGVSVRAYEKQIEEFMGEKLRALGLIKTIEHKTVRRYYTHSTSHFLGIDPHDSGDYDRPLETGTVLTVEPGIYIPEENIGIRIEDDVVITDDGIKILSNKLPNAL